MAIKVQPTRIKQSVYLLVPKDIAELIGISDRTVFTLHIKRNGRKQVLEYSFN